jgi:hypothetical protein
LAPLVQCGKAIFFELGSFIEMAIEIEMVVDRGVNGGSIL